MIHSWPVGHDKSSQLRAYCGIQTAPPETLGLPKLGITTQTSGSVQLTLSQLAGNGGKVGGEKVLDGRLVKTPVVSGLVKGVAVEGVPVVVVGGLVGIWPRTKLNIRTVRSNPARRHVEEVTMLGCIDTIHPESPSPQFVSLQISEVFTNGRTLTKIQLAAVKPTAGID